MGSPFCVFGCQLQAVVFLSVHGLVQFWIYVILGIGLLGVSNHVIWTKLDSRTLDGQTNFT